MDRLKKIIYIFNNLVRNLTLIALGIFVVLLEPITINNVLALLKSNVEALNINGINQLLSVFNMHATLLVQSFNVAKLAIVICTLLVSAQAISVNCIIPYIKTTTDNVDNNHHYTANNQLSTSESKSITATIQLRC